MLDALKASAPHPGHASKLMLYGQFVGSWDIEGVLIAADGSRSEHRGEWHFGWVLEGRAIQDVLISPPRGTGGPAFEYGTTLRFYDPRPDAWEIIWASPMAPAVRRLVGRAAGEEIIQQGRGASGRLLRWTFSGIAPGTFTWRGFISEDDGANWRQNEEMIARRR